jgi:hypothetical protein
MRHLTNEQPKVLGSLERLAARAALAWARPFQGCC